MTLNSVNRIVFVEDRFQVQWIRKNIQVNDHTKLIALTAQAMLALEEAGLPFTPISEVADTRLLAAAERQYSVDCLNLLKNIEGWVLEKYGPAAKIGPGFLTGQAYYIQISIGGIAARAFLMREAVQLFAPGCVVTFHGDIDNWFAKDGYLRNPWIETLYTICAAANVQVEIVSIPKEAISLLIAKIKSIYLRVRSRSIQLVKDILAYWKKPRAQDKGNKPAFRLLFADARSYDWSPVLGVLKKNDEFSVYYLNSKPSGGGPWGLHYSSTLYDDFLWNGQPLNCQPLRFEKKERAVLVLLLDKWIETHPEQAEMKILGMDIFPALLPNLRSMLSQSLPVARYSKHLANAALDIARPDAICFFATPRLSAKVLAVQAQHRDIPVVTYQHGGSYGVQEVPTHDLAEFAYSDYFLTYGDGVRPPENPVIPTRAQFVSVGSTYMQNMLAKNCEVSVKHEMVSVLWIAEVSLKNTIGTAWLVEDTARYQLQKESLELLSQAKNINVVYRPFPSQKQAQATPHWIEQSGFSNIKLDTQTSLKDSIIASDLVICDSSSSTTWNETLALGKPLIVYCDPKQTILMDHFAKDLAQACYWCRSVPELLDAMDRLVDHPREFLNELRSRSTDDFLRKYVLHQGNSVEQVSSFLSAVCRAELKHD